MHPLGQRVQTPVGKVPEDSSSPGLSYDSVVPSALPESPAVLSLTGAVADDDDAFPFLPLRLADDFCDDASDELAAEDADSPWLSPCVPSCEEEPLADAVTGASMAIGAA